MDVPVEGASTTIHELRHTEPENRSSDHHGVPENRIDQHRTLCTTQCFVIIANPVTTNEIIALTNQLDIPRGDMRVKLHPLKHSSAKILAPCFPKYLQTGLLQVRRGKASPGSPVKIIPESRLNALIIIADRIDTERVLNLVDELDVPQSVSGDNWLRLVPLEYTSAKRMARYCQRFFRPDCGR